MSSELWLLIIGGVEIAAGIFLVARWNSLYQRGQQSAYSAKERALHDLLQLGTNEKLNGQLQKVDARLTDLERSSRDMLASQILMTANTTALSVQVETLRIESITLLTALNRRRKEEPRTNYLERKGDVLEPPKTEIVDPS